MYGALDISTSGMVAQRTRLDAIAANIANAKTVYDVDGERVPYRRRIVHFAAGDPTAASSGGREMGVHVKEIELDQSPFNKRWDPSSPEAVKSGPDTGYVLEPNVNTVWEQINAVEAARAYEANIVAAEATKSMLGQALRLIA
jgi:flagellar basal-body rod protein FlgC